MKYHLLFCLGIFAFAHANTPLQDPFPHQQPNKETDEDWEPFSEAKPAETNQKNPSSTSTSNNEILTAKRKPLDPELAELVINMSSEKTRKLALILQQCAQDPNEECPPRVLLIGAPGIGKTTFIQAVAENAHIPLKIINSPFVSDKYKDSGPVNLQIIFDSFLQTKTRIIVALDELHCLTDGHKNSNNPDPNTAAALWKLLDQCLENPNIIIVGILNDGSNMPEQLKSRFEKCTYIMKSSDEIAQIQQILHHYLKKRKHNCDEKCQQYIARLLKTGEARSIEGTVEMAYWDAHIQEGRQITQKNLETAIKEGNENKKELNKNEPDQATKTLIAQEDAAKWVKRGAVAGVVEVTVGWKNIFKKTASVAVYFGKAGIDLYAYGKKPDFQEIFTNIAKDTLFEEVRPTNDKEQK